jgi:CBS domain containing-hemolysin-like protein
MTAVFYFAIVLLPGPGERFLRASEFALVGVRRSRIETLAAQGNRARGGSFDCWTI